MYKLIIISLLLFNICNSNAQQSVDTTFHINIDQPNYSSNNSPVVFIDALHNNLHKESGNFAPFAKLLRKDGYEVKSLKKWKDLKKADLLVIANAINKKNVGNWERPIYSAFNESEIENLVNFVENGGNLLLIADHMPFAGAAADLVQAFGFDICDGFAQLAKNGNSPDAFSITNNRLLPSILTNGTIGKKVSSVITFTGSSFSIPKNATGILKFLDRDVCIQPNVAWQFNDTTPKESLLNKYQGAIMQYGKGQIAVFGEAAMFTAQKISQNGSVFKVGYNSSYASQNVDFIRNLLYWLTQNKLTINSNDKLEEEILIVNKQMEKTFNTKSYSDIAHFYTEDAVIVGGNNTEVIGKKNIIEYWSKFSGNLTWKLENIEIKRLGENIALQRGYSKVYYQKPDGTEGLSKSIFSLIWTKTENKWRIMLDHYSAS